MWLTKGNLNVKVTRASDEEVEWLRSKDSGLTFSDKRGLFAKGEVDRVRFYDLLESTFPAGFLPGVMESARACGIQAQVIDGRGPGPVAIPSPLTADGSTARGYQLDAETVAVRLERGIIQIATGGGKTNVAVAIAQRFPTVRWLFLAHRATLMEQAAERYEALTGNKAGRIGEGAWNEEAHFTCATFQSLSSALKKGKHLASFKAWTGLIVDEAHTLPAASYYEVSMALPNARLRLGISATPLDREDKRGVFAVASLGPVIYEHRADSLIKAGYLAKPLIKMVKVKQEFRQVDQHGLIRRWKWNKVYDEGVVRSLQRNRALLAAVARAEKPCLVFVKEILHGKAFDRALKARSLRSDFIWGDASLQARKDAVRRLLRGDTEVLVSSVIFQEGVDIPELRSVVVASGGKSVIAALQRIGRGMRRSDGKDTFEVWDVADEGEAWLERHAKARRLAYQREKFQVSVVSLVPSAPTDSQQRALPLGAP
jgi:superfamily II DNA or RNA helicase